MPNGPCASRYIPTYIITQIGREMLQQLDRRDLEGVIAHFSPDARFSGWAPQPLDVAGYR